MLTLSFQINCDFNTVPHNIISTALKANTTTESDTGHANRK